MVKNEGCIYLFYGEEDFLKEEAEKAIIAKFLPPDSQRLNCDRYSAKEYSSDIFDALMTPPLLSDRKVVIIKDVEDLPESKKEQFLKYLKNPQAHLSIILQSSQTYLNDSFLKEISRYAKTYSFRKLKVRELKGWIYERINLHRKTIEKEALDLLLELKGSESLAALSKELEKLVTYKYDKRVITKEDVSGLVGKSLAKRVFDLMDAVSFKDRDAALLLAHEISSRNKKDIHEVMGLMGWQFRRVWKAKVLLARREGREAITRKLRLRNFSADKFLNQVKRFDEDELQRDFKFLLEADRTIKTGYKKSEFVLEQLIIRLCGA